MKPLSRWVPVLLGLLEWGVFPAHAQAQTPAPAPAPRAILKLPFSPPAEPPANATPAQQAEYKRQSADYERRRWNYVLTDSAARAKLLNEQPNALLVETVRNRPAGTALDVGMGEGRNALYLARQGWQVTGVDVADQALAYAQRKAGLLGVRLTTVDQDVNAYDWGTNKWDLIVVSYAGGRNYADRVKKALKPGGVLVLEGFHADAAKDHKIGEGVVFQTDELKKLYAGSGLKIVRYEEPVGRADFGKQQVRLVKLVAQKP